MDQTKEKIVKIQDGLGRFFREEIAHILKDIQNIEGEIMEINSEILESKKKQEIFRYQDRNQTRDVFSPFMLDNSNPSLYQQQQETLDERYQYLKEQSTEAREKLTFFREKGSELKEIANIVTEMIELEINRKNDIIKEIDSIILPHLKAISTKVGSLEKINSTVQRRIQVEGREIKEEADKAEQELQNIKSKLLQDLIQFL